VKDGARPLRWQIVSATLYFLLLLPILTAAFYFFCILTALMILRPARDALGMQRGIDELRCEHQYASELETDMSRMSIQDSVQYSQYSQYAQPIPIEAQYQYFGTQTGFESPESPPPLLHRRTNSSSGFSQRSQTSSNTTGSSERDGYTPARGMPSPQPIRAPNGWTRTPGYISPPNSHPSLFAGAP
jgi:hypothetical protein